MCSIKFRLKILICFVVALLSILIFNIPAFACSGVYVGCQANDQGTSLVARSSDSGRFNKPIHLKVYGGSDGQRLQKIESDNGFVYEFGDTFYRFICSPADEVTDSAGYYAFAINDMGVSISSTVTGYSSPDSLKFNPYVENGLCEDIMPLIVGAQAKTAREGIEILAKIVDDRGSAEDNILMISDQNECWYMEIYGGHQYCAVKAPEDCVACIGNEFAITTEYATCADAICSSGLFDMPRNNNFAVYNADGKMNIFNTYVGENRHTDFSHLRTWGGHHLMAPSSAGTYSTNMYLPLFYKPDKKVSVKDVADVFRYRYEDTEYNPDKNGRDDIRVIATEEQTKTHILQTYKNLDPGMCSVCWFSPNTAEFADFVPVSNCQSMFADSYIYVQDKYAMDQNSAASVIRQLNTLCAQNRSKLGPGVKLYWKFIETYENAILPGLIEKGNKNEINEFCKFMEDQTFFDAKRLINEVNWYLMSNTITWKKDIDLMTLQYSDNIRENYVPNVDAALIAKMTGWNIDQMQVRQRDGKYDNNAPGVGKQADVGGQEAYLKISKNGKTIELTTTNGHHKAHGKLVVNGQESEYNATLLDDKVLAPFDFVNILCDGNYQNFDNYVFVNTNPSQKAQNPFELFLSWPLWSQILVIVVIAVVFFLVGYFIAKITKSYKKTNKKRA